MIGYSCPLAQITHCDNCGFHSVESVGEGIKELTQEEAVRVRPHMYLNCGVPELEKLAAEAIAEQETL